MTHICVSKLTSIGSDNGLSPGRRQAIIWTNDGILLIRTFRTHFSEIVSKIHTFSFKKIHLKMSSGKWQPCCLGLRVYSMVYAHNQYILWWPFTLNENFYSHCNLMLLSVYFTLQKTWLLMSWRHKEPGHQQPWYWPNSTWNISVSVPGGVSEAVCLVYGDWSALLQNPLGNFLLVAGTF